MRGQLLPYHFGNCIVHDIAHREGDHGQPWKKTQVSIDASRAQTTESMHATDIGGHHELGHAVSKLIFGVGPFRGECLPVCSFTVEEESTPFILSP